MSVVTDGAAILRSVLESPADDAPRLIYADWLDDEGDGQQAAFIRTQVALARMPDRPCAAAVAAGLPRCNDCGWCRLRDRECELLTRPNGRKWTPAPVREALPYFAVDLLNVDDQRPWGMGVRFARGFIEAVRADGDTLLRLYEPLLALCPVTTFELTWMPSVDRIGREFVRRDWPGGLRVVTHETRDECLRVLWPGIRLARRPPLPPLT